MAVIELPCGMLVGLSIRYRQVPLWMGPFMDISCREPTGFNRNRIWMYDLCQTSFRVPSNLAQPEIGCMIYDKQAFRVPPDSAQPEIGCMIYDKQAFRVPSNLAQTEDGCRASTRQAFSRAIRFGDKPKRMEKVPEMCQKSAQESFKSLHSHPSPQKYSPIKHGRDD